MAVLRIVFILKSEPIIGCTVKNTAQFFNGKDCDVLIFPELIESVLVNSFVNQGIIAFHNHVGDFLDSIKTNIFSYIKYT